MVCSLCGEALYLFYRGLILIHADLFIRLWNKSVHIHGGCAPGFTDDFFVGKVGQPKWEHMRLTSKLISAEYGCKWVEKSTYPHPQDHSLHNPRMKSASALKDLANFARRFRRIRSRRQVQWRHAWSKDFPSDSSYWEIDEIPAFESYHSIPGTSSLETRVRINQRWHSLSY